MTHNMCVGGGRRNNTRNNYKLQSFTRSKQWRDSQVPSVLLFHRSKYPELRGGSWKTKITTGIRYSVYHFIYVFTFV